MTQPSTTRRDLLRFGTSAAAYAAGAAIVTGGVVLASEAKGATGVSPELSRLIAEVDRCSAANAAYDADVYDPARDRMLAAVAEAERTLPHTVVNTGPNTAGGNMRWATDNSTAVAMCKAIGRRGSLMAVNNPEVYADARRLVAASFRRECAIKAVRESYRLGELVEQSNALCGATAEAQEVVAAYPAHTLADLHAKVAFMARRDMGNGMDRLPEILADVARLSGVEA